MAVKVKFLISREIPSIRAFAKDEVVELENNIAMELERQGFVEIKKEKHKKKNIEYEADNINNDIGGQ